MSSVEGKVKSCLDFKGWDSSRGKMSISKHWLTLRGWLWLKLYFLVYFLSCIDFISISIMNTTCTTNRKSLSVHKYFYGSVIKYINPHYHIMYSISSLPKPNITLQHDIFSCNKQDLMLRQVYRCKAFTGDVKISCRNSDFSPSSSSSLMEGHVRDPCCAPITTASIYLMQMRHNLLCTQVCFIIQNLSGNPDG